MDKLFDTPAKKIIFGIIIAVIFIWLVHLIFFNKTETETETKPIKPVKPVRHLESKRISITNNPEDIKNGKYREVPNSDFFGYNPNIFQFLISIKFNLEIFNNTLQSIIGNVQNDSANNWGLWVTPQRKLQWRVNNLSWDLNNFGELKNNTLYEIVITYDDDNKYMLFLNVLSSIKQEEYFNVIEPKPIMIDAPPLNKNSGVVTFGGDYPQSNTNSKFLGSINQIITREVVFISPTIPSPNVLGIASQYQVVGEGCTNCLYYSSWCSNVPNKICFGEYRLRFSNGVISPITIKTDAGSNQGLTDPDLRFKLSNIPSDGVSAILQVKNVATNSNDNNWYDVNVPSQFIKPPDKNSISKKQDEVTFKGNTAQPKKINKKENINCVSDRIPHSSSTADNHKYLGKFNSYEECVEKAEIPSNAKAITWHKPNGGDWDNTCFSIGDNNTNVADNKTTCGVLSEG